MYFYFYTIKKEDNMENILLIVTIIFFILLLIITISYIEKCGVKRRRRNRKINAEKICKGGKRIENITLKEKNSDNNFMSPDEVQSSFSGYEFFTSRLTEDDLSLTNRKNQPVVPFDNIGLKSIGPGPFVLKDGVTKIYIYNPSIDLDENGDIVCVNRLTGRIAAECKKIFDPSDFSSSDVIEKEISRFPKTFQPEISSVVYFKLNNPNDFKVLYTFPLQSLCHSKWTKHSPEAQGLEDPRLFTFQKELWVYSHFRGDINTNTNTNQMCAHIPVIFKVSEPNKLIKLTMDNMMAIEKNWMPFEYNGQLYFEYSITPHIIIHCDLKTGVCTKAYETDYKKAFFEKHFGGGAPPKLFLYNGHYFYLGFGHTRENEPKTTRKNFFYVFRADPPFDIILLGDEFDVLDPPKDIEFGSGLLIRNNKQVIISAGIEDCYGIIKDYDLETILKTLRRV